MSLGKLKDEIRSIYVFKKSRSKFRGDEIDKINIDAIPLTTLKSIISPYPDDPCLIYAYKLRPGQLKKIFEIIGFKGKPDHKNYEYIIETYGVYEKPGTE